MGTYWLNASEFVPVEQNVEKRARNPCKFMGILYC